MAKHLISQSKKRNTKLQTKNFSKTKIEKMVVLGEITSGIIHEINNIITYVNTNLLVAKKHLNINYSLHEKYNNIINELEQNESQKLNQALNSIKIFKEKHQFYNIINDLQNLTDESIDGIKKMKTITKDIKIFTGADLQYKKIDINKSIDSAWNILQTEFKHKVIIEKNYQKLPKIKCLPVKINQIFVNILINAAQAIKDKGTIKITTKISKKKTKLSKNIQKFVQIKIADTGCGIDNKIISKIFDPFFTTKKSQIGTGLGLSITKDIISEHKGNINVKSVLDKGTEFVILLPAII